MEGANGEPAQTVGYPAYFASPSTTSACGSVRK
jgi:hypothetical protein